jgi:hypothetical protein
MNEDKLKKLNELLYEYFDELNEIQKQNDENSNNVFLIEDEIENYISNKGYDGIILQALRSEQNRLEKESWDIEEKYYKLADYGDIKSLIEDINELWVFL